MAENSKIEWTDHTFNPWIGCTKVSPACDHCYAEAFQKRCGGPKWGKGESRRRTSAQNWTLPLRWNRKAAKEGHRMRVFCASLADVFDAEVPDAWRDDLFALIAATPHLDWLLVTKRPKVALDYADRAARCGEHWLADKEAPPAQWPLPNVWMGGTVENRAMWKARVGFLKEIAATKTFLSVEPLLEDLGEVDLHGIDWVIAGGESGPKARPSHPDWFRSLRDQCAAAGVPFLMKQWGEWAPTQPVPGGDLGGAMRADRVRIVKPAGENDGHFRRGDALMERVGKRNAGRLLDGVLHDGYPGSANHG